MEDKFKLRDDQEQALLQFRMNASRLTRVELEQITIELMVLYFKTQNHAMGMIGKSLLGAEHA